MFSISFCSCLCTIHWSQMFCSWSSANRRCSNYIWVMNNSMAHSGVAYIRGLTVSISFHHLTMYIPYYMYMISLYCIWLWLYHGFVMNSSDLFSCIFQDYFSDLGAILSLPQYQSSKAEASGWNWHLPNHNKTQQSANHIYIYIFLGVYCTPMLLQGPILLAHNFQHGWMITSVIKCWMKLLIYSKTSTVQQCWSLGMDM